MEIVEPLLRFTVLCQATLAHARANQIKNYRIYSTCFLFYNNICIYSLHARTHTLCLLPTWHAIAGTL